MKFVCMIAAVSVGLSGYAVASDPFKPGRKDQVKLGQRAADSLRQSEKVLPDSDTRVRLLRKVGGRLMATLSKDENKDFQFSFDVIDSKELNAFALPGGPVFFYTGLLSKFKTEDELAGVLAHEMTHVRKEHWANAYAANQKRKLGLSALLLILRANDTIFDLAGISDDLLFTLPYSRRHETESDDLGLDSMVAAGYNPEGMAHVFEILREASKDKPPEFISTHPDDKNRINRIRERAKKMNKSFPPERPLPWVKDPLPQFAHLNLYGNFSRLIASSSKV